VLGRATESPRRPHHRSTAGAALPSSVRDEAERCPVRLATGGDAWGVARAV